MSSSTKSGFDQFLTGLGVVLTAVAEAGAEAERQRQRAEFRRREAERLSTAPESFSDLFARHFSSDIRVANEDRNVVVRRGGQVIFAFDWFGDIIEAVVVDNDTMERIARILEVQSHRRAARQVRALIV